MAPRLPSRSLAFLIVIAASVFCFVSAAPPEYKGVIKGPWAAAGEAAKNATDTPLKAVDITGLPDGDYIFSMKDGVVNIRPFVLLTPSEVPIPPAPGPTPTPVPVPNTRSDLFKAAGLAVAADPARETTAKMLAQLYREESKLVRSGQIPDAASLKAVVSQTSDLVLKKPSATATAWQPVRDLLGTQWTLIDAKPGHVITDYAVLLDDAALGLDQSAPLKQISPEMIALIMQIIMLVMKIFFPM